MFNKIFRRFSSADSASASSSPPETPGKEEVIEYIQRSPDWVDVPLEEFCRKPADFPPTPLVVQPPKPKVVEVHQPKTEEQEMLETAQSLVREAQQVLEVEKTKEAFLSSTELEIEKLQKLQGEARAIVLSNRARGKRAKNNLNILCEFDPYAKEEEEEETPSPSPTEDDLWY